MYWFKTKTLLIIIFFFINIFLMTSMLISTNKAIVVDDDTIQNTIEVLNKNGITIDKSLILKKAGNLSMLKIENVLKNADMIAVKLFNSEEYIKTEKDNITIYSYNNEKLIFDDAYFEYINPIDVNYFTNKERVKDYINNFFDRIGINKKHVNIGNIRKTGDGYTGLCKYKYKKQNIFGADIKVMIGNNIHIQGYGILPTEFSQEKYPIRHITSKLISFMGSEKMNENVPIIITDTALGYLTQQESMKSDFKDMLIIPAWKITTDSNNVYYYDAIKGNE